MLVVGCTIEDTKDSEDDRSFCMDIVDLPLHS